MKTFKRGVKWGAYKFVPKAFNLIVILTLVLQPAGTSGIWNIAFAESTDPALPVVEEAAPVSELVQEEKTAPVAEKEVVTPPTEEVVAPESASPAEEPVPVVIPEPEVIPPVVEETTATSPETATPTPAIGDTGATTDIPSNNEETAVTSPEIPTPTEETAPTDTPPATEPVEAPVSQETPVEVVPVVPVEETECLAASVVGDTETNWTVDADRHTAVTNDVVQLGVRYVFPLDKEVSITFTCLPKDLSKRAPLSIERIKASDINLPEGTIAVSDYAYDITTNGMSNEDFKYDLSLPKSDVAGAKVKYIEQSADEVVASDVTKDELKAVDEKNVKEETHSVTVSDLDHFTIFIVTTPGNTPTLATAVVNGQASVTVPPSTNVTVTMKVTTDAGEGWRSSQYNIGSGWICVDTNDLTSNGTNTESFIISAPAVVGTYNFSLLANSGAGCTGAVSSPAYVMNGAITVKTPAPPLTPPALPNNPGDTYALTSVTGVWTAINGGSDPDHTGLNTNEIHWGIGVPGPQKSGLRFENSGAQSFNEGNPFYLGMLTHFNWPVQVGTAASGATLKITLQFSRPGVSPNPFFNYDFAINETLNSAPCPSFQQTSTPCDDKITFPNSYGDQTFTIGDIAYTLQIDGFVNAFPSGSPVPAFITEEQQNSSAFLVGHLSSILVERPDIRITKKTNDIDVLDTHGPELSVGDTVNWSYVVQNSGNVTLTGITVTDNPSVTISCPETTLAAGDSMTCTASGTVSAGQFTNTATASGTPPTGGAVNDSDTSYYFGSVSTGTITIVKDAVPNDAQDFSFTTTGAGLSNFSLDDDGDNGNTLSNTQVFSNVTPGTYAVSEGGASGWTLSNISCVDPTNNSSGNLPAAPTATINLAAGENITCTFTNTQLSDVHGYKWNDLNGSGTRDCIGGEPAFDSVCELEPLLSGWTVFIDANGNGQFDAGETSMNTSASDDEHFGWYWFENLLPGAYSICEVPQAGWNQTYPTPQCHTITLPNDNACGFGQSVNAVAGSECDFGNHFTPPVLQVSKANDSGAPETPGNDVLYTITVTAPEGNTTEVADVHVTDLPPAGFIYRSGSWTASSSDGSHTGMNLSHAYASPGVWSLGTMKPGEVITLTYVADISGSQDAGDYNDLAYARGTSAVGADVLANAPDPFVGTDVEVILPAAPVAVALTNTVERNVDTKTIHKTKRVLGAATVLPYTGANINTVLFALMLLLSGLILLLLSKRSTWLLIRSLSKSMTKVFLFAVIGSLLLTSQSASAASTLNVQIETPKAQVSDSNFKIGFVVLDISNGTPAVTCEVNDGGGFVPFPAAHIEYVAQSGGNSGNCVVDDTVMPIDGTYAFRVTADSVPSAEVPVKLVSGTPSTPLNYSRTSCTVSFKTANDGLTDTVELYRSTSSTFTADASTFVDDIAIIPNTPGTITDLNGDCGGSYFYAIRAVAASGLGSGFVGDESVVIDNEHKVKIKTTTKHIAGPTTVATGAIPVTGGAAAAGTVEGAATGGEETTQPSAGQEGAVLGEATEGETALTGGIGSWIMGHPWWSAFIFLLLLALGYYGYDMYQEKKSDNEPLQ